MATKIRNVEKLIDKLNRIPGATRAKIRPALQNGANQITSLQKRLVPVRSGELRKSIGWSWRGMPSLMGVASEAAGVWAQSNVHQQGSLIITIYAGNRKAFYARWVEFGTSKMAAQPYFFPGYRAVRKSVKNEIRAAARAAIKDMARG